MPSVRQSKAVRSLPISVRALGREAGLPGQVPVRELLRRTGMFTKPVHIKVLRYTWGTVAPDARNHPIWPDAALNEILHAPNGWSLGDFWSDATLRLFELRFSVEPWRVLVNVSHKDARDDRGGVVDKCRHQAEQDGVSFEGVDRIVAMVHPPPVNAGAVGGNAVLDQGAFGLSFFQHELGHVLGFEHAFGPCGDYVYQDDYSVMGFSAVQTRAIAVPAAFTGVQVLEAATFWNSDRALSPAALYRYAGDFAASSSVIRVDLATRPRVRLAAFGQAGLHDPVLAVASTAQGEIMAEYRARFGQDGGVQPAVVVHSLRRRPVLRWHGEQDPVWYEGHMGVSSPVPSPGPSVSVDTVFKAELVSVTPDLRYVEVVLS
ncbi:hypothetical protein [Nonomuraea typhae]|uniref:Peptidase metallopeptidase domain-containing protein n=1 Tax=Nonomuraea typhae TaxID=2603600 RepID=A0ABW7YJS0_9ACTN